MSKGRKGPRYLTHDEDKKLVVKALSGDNLSYSILAEKYKPILYTAVRRRMWSISEEEAEDITMASLGRAFVYLKTYDPAKSKLFSWMIYVCHNYMNSIPRKKKSIENIRYSETEKPIETFANSTESDDISGNLDKSNKLKLVRRLVEKLDPECRDVFMLKYFREMSNEEIAEEMGIKETDVYYRAKKGKDQLKKWLKNYGLFE